MSIWNHQACWNGGEVEGMVKTYGVKCVVVSESCDMWLTGQNLSAAVACLVAEVKDVVWT